MTTSSPRLRRTADILFDQCAKELAAIAVAINNKESSTDVRATLASVSHCHAVHLHQLIGDPVSSENLRKQLLTWLHAHQWHREFLLKSSFIAHALAKPRGYAGDADLMSMICENEDRGESPFARAKNRVYLDLPAAAAVRRRANALALKLAELPEGARVLNLACGPALEVRKFLANHPQRDISFVLLDHDPETINRVNASTNDVRCVTGLANAFQIMKGDASVLIPRPWHRTSVQPLDFHGWRQVLIPFRYARCDLASVPKFDLVYSSGLFDYVRYTPDNPSRGTSGLTSRLFSLVKPGGHLLIGNFRSPGLPDNPHEKHHMTMMDMYSDWRLIYRSNDEIAGFADTLPRQSIESSLLNETLEPVSNGGVIGFLKVKRLH
jgi:extracellular factor (EF) 3-hydroxypalmitic acid methyl ester biosynthesis protein